MLRYRHTPHSVALSWLLEWSPPRSSVALQWILFELHYHTEVEFKHHAQMMYITVGYSEFLGFSPVLLCLRHKLLMGQRETIQSRFFFFQCRCNVLRQHLGWDVCHRGLWRSQSDHLGSFTCAKILTQEFWFLHQSEKWPLWPVLSSAQEEGGTRVCASHLPFYVVYTGTVNFVGCLHRQANFS